MFGKNKNKRTGIGQALTRFLLEYIFVFTFSTFIRFNVELKPMFKKV
jgi:hypothetical protein